MRKLEKCKLTALLPAAYMLRGAKKLGSALRQKSTRITALLLAVVMVVSLVPMKASAASQDINGKSYTLTDNGQMAYWKKDASTIDVVRMLNNGHIQTTDSDTAGNPGFIPGFFPGGNTESYTGYKYVSDMTDNDMRVSYTASSYDGGRYVKLTLTVTAKRKVSDKKLAIYADTNIGGDDNAAIEVIKSGNKVIGLKMTNKSDSNKTVSLYFAGKTEVTDADNYWFGKYSNLSSKYYSNTDLSSYSNGDSSFAVSWNDIDLSKNRSATFSIIIGVDTKPAPSLAAPVAQNSITYGAKLSAVGLNNGWKWEDSTIEPTVQNSGYDAYYAPSDSELKNYDWAKVDGWNGTTKRVERTVAVTVNKANITYTAPKAISGLTYTGAARTLISAGSANGGTIQYALGTATAATGTWGTTLPSATNAGTYYVWYKVIGDANHNDVRAQKIVVSIGKANAAYIAPTAKTDLVYTGSALTLINEGSATGGTMWYALAGYGSHHFDWKTTPPTATDAGTYYVFYKVVGDANHNDVNHVDPAFVAVTINKADATCEAPTAIAGLTYTGAARTLIAAGSATGGTIMYALGTENKATGTWGTTLPSATNAGTYYVWYKVVGDRNHNDVDPDFVAVTIGKANATCDAPEAVAGLIYSGEAQTLVVAGSAVGGTMEYALGTENAATGTWGTTLPSATNAGTYYVWYKVIGDANHNDVAPAFVAVTIGKANATCTAPTANTGLVYSGAAQTLIGAGTAVGGTIQYALGTATEATGTWSTTLPSATEAGTYYVWYKVVGDENHNDVEPNYVLVTVAQKEVTLTWSSLAEPLTYSGKAYVLTATLGGIVAGDDCTVTVEPVGSNVNAGTFCYRATALSNANYKLPANADSRSYTIGKKDITVAMVNCEIYVGDWPEYSYTVEGLLDGDELIAGPGYGTSADLKKPGVYTVYLDGADAGPNYSVTHVEGKLTVKEAAADVKPTYSVTVGNVVNGNVTASVKTATAGDTVTLTLAPANGYKLGTLSAAGGGNAVALTRVSDTVYSFTMPAANVTVGAVFVASDDCDRGASCPMNAYDDLDAGKWYHDGVHYCIENGLMIGDDKGNFAPEASLTRAALVSILWRMEGEPKVDHKLTFKDVAADAWYAEAIAWANSVDIVNGYSNNKFGPNDEITREQMAAILYRYADYTGELGAFDSDAAKGFSDWKNVSKWAEAAVAWACDEGLISGIEEGNKVILAPKGTASRAQIASVIYRYIANI